jgi:hypothetical protein
MGFDTKTVQELELLTTHLRQQMALHPEYRLERVMLQDCEKWLAIRRKEEKRRIPAAAKMPRERRVNG